VIARFNAIGYSGTNASGNLVIRDSEWADNMSGIVPNTLDREGLAPQRGQTIVNNWVHDNNNRGAPAYADFFAFFGIGIAVLGGRDDEVAYNRVAGHVNAGIAVSFVVDENVWLAERDRVHDNVVSGSGIADLALTAPAGGASCFAGNSFGTSLPPLIEDLYACGSLLGAIGGGHAGLSFAGLGRLVRASALGNYPHGNVRDVPPAPAQAGMPDTSVAPAVAGPASRVDPTAEVRRAASLQRAVTTERSTPTAVGAVYLVLGYGLPIAFVVAAAWALLTRLRRKVAPKRRFVLVPLAAYALFALTLFGVEILRP
jgi:hypothetical protein